MQKETVENQAEIVINTLLDQFHRSVESVANSPDKYQELLEEIYKFNPYFEPITVEAKFSKTEVLANVVAGVYAPLIHAFTGCILNNIQEGFLPNTVLAPPRDALPLATALKAQAEISQVPIHILTPHVNRNTAGIANNQKLLQIGESPLLQQHLDQVVAEIQDASAIVEMETGVYGTTSLVMAEAFKNRGTRSYLPIKFYGLGPNTSYIHAILSDGQSWNAEQAENSGMVDVETVNTLMVLLDTMEELGMENFYQSVEALVLDDSGKVIPVIVPTSPEEQEVATVTNQVIADTASLYANIGQTQVKTMLLNVPSLIEASKQGLPITLTAPIPSMDSKENHFQMVRDSQLFDYLELKI